MQETYVRGIFYYFSMQLLLFISDRLLNFSYSFRITFVLCLNIMIISLQFYVCFVELKITILNSYLISKLSLKLERIIKYKITYTCKNTLLYSS